MKIITVINAKGGCGKSTIAMNLASAMAHHGYRTLLIDMDPQSQITQWLRRGDGLNTTDTLVAALTGRQPLKDVIQNSGIPELRFIASAEGLEDLGRQITDVEGYHSMLTRLLSQVSPADYEFIIIDSPNQISPVMENAIYPSDLFIVPFESTKAVRSYANFFKLLVRLRPAGDYQIMHVLSNLTRLPGLRKRAIALMRHEGIVPAESEVRSCGWLAQVDEHGGSIFDYRPHSRGAHDIKALAGEVFRLTNHRDGDRFINKQPTDSTIAPTLESAITNESSTQ